MEQIDIVVILRKHERDYARVSESSGMAVTFRRAADEIEALRAEIERLRRVENGTIRQQRRPTR